MAEKFLKTHPALVVRIALWLLSSLVFAGLLSFTDYLDDGVQEMPNLKIIRGTGLIAICQLIISLSITPFTKLFSRQFKSSWAYHIRRESGIQAGLLAVIHSLYSLQYYVDWQWWLVWERVWLTSGFIAMGLLLLLLASSPNAVRQKMNTALWKRLHQSVYPATIFISIHVLLVSHGAIQVKIVLSILLGTLLIWRFVISTIRAHSKIETDTV